MKDVSDSLTEARASHDALFRVIERLVACHSPSGHESEIDGVLLEGFTKAGLAPTMDAAGNIIAKVPGRKTGSLAITAHKDEIGARVVNCAEDGTLRVRAIGGSFPWVYGEGMVDVLGEHECIPGVLSFGSRHVSHASPQHAHKADAPLRWAEVWIETKLTPSELDGAGVRPGTPVVVGRQRKQPVRLKEHICSYALDNKASLAILLDLARSLREPACDVYLVCTAREEIGAVGAMFLTRQMRFDAMLALEIAPIAPEYSVVSSSAPVLVAEDGIATYDGALNALIRASAAALAVPLQHAILNGFGSDASYAMKAGHVPRGACLGFPTQNTHGYEIAPLAAIINCRRVVEAMCQEPLPTTD